MEHAQTLSTPTQSLTRLSQAISLLLHPLTIPLWAGILMLFGNTLMATMPLSIKWFFLAVLALNTLVAPALCIGLLRAFRLIPDLRLSEPRQRLIPILIVLLSYVSCLMMLSDVMMAFLIRRFLFAAMGCVVLTLIITPFWKISLHMTSIGGLLALLTALNASGLGQFPYTLVLFILLAGLLGSARALAREPQPRTNSGGTGRRLYHRIAADLVRLNLWRSQPINGPGSVERSAVTQRYQLL